MGRCNLAATGTVVNGAAAPDLDLAAPTFPSWPGSRPMRPWRRPGNRQMKRRAHAGSIGPPKFGLAEFDVYRRPGPSTGGSSHQSDSS
jgi:hypothetical protein